MRVAQVSCALAIVLLTVSAPSGRAAIALGGGVLGVCAMLAIVAVARSRAQLTPVHRRVFDGVIVAGALAFAGKTWWTVDLLSDSLAAPYPAASDYLMAAAQIAVALAFVRGLGRGRQRLRFETAVDIALVSVAAVILFLPMRLGEVMSLEGAQTHARVMAVVSLFGSATSLLLLALLIAWRGEEFSRRALLGLTVGAIATSVFTAWAANLAISGAPIPHTALDVLGVAAILGFVSALELPNAPTSLELRVAERTAQLSGAVQQLTEQIGRERATRAEIVERERLASIGSVVAGAAHQVNNPLSAISAYAQLLLQEGGLTPDQRESVEIINAEAMRASSVIRDLRAFAKHNPGDSRAVDLNELIERTLRLREYQMSTANIRTETVLDEQLPTVVGDPHQLQQVVNNLLENSLHAMGQQGQGVLRIVTRTIDKGILFEITDTGPGIAPAARDRIFDPFFTTRPEGQGTGLGLSVAYGIVTTHGGKIRLSDGTPGHTTFTVELPCGSRRSPVDSMGLALSAFA